MNAQQMVDQTQTLILDADATVLTEPEILRFLNEAQSELATRTKSFIKQASQAVTVPTPDPPEYSLPADCVGIDKIDSASWGPIRLDEVSTADLDRFSSGWQAQTAVAASAYVRDMRAPKILRLWPRPTVADTLNYRYFATPADVLLSGTSELPTWMHPLVVLSMTAIASGAESDIQEPIRAAHFKQRFDEWTDVISTWWER